MGRGETESPAEGTASRSSHNCLRSANLSGKSVRRSAKTSPLRPCGRRMRASHTHCSGVSGITGITQSPGNLIAAGLAQLVFFQDVERVTMMQLHAHGAQNRAHRARSAALLADHLAHILRRDAELE